ncbi:3-oxo-5-alpha-steroid 4-dehydrogenase 2a isoform X1 [Tachysurus fulvidraco]|uniref:3-oxo-5-alpha-steroid 4-dehydrogenase 2a isoform X1 n=1 Tax=Tachysurus fulvidraco TaxID=1234273 RepID=UPI000F4DD1FE|nr:3-oxo-5-alpha-steroid 4-dehydrogenase 2a isoform X1 [Tachysurus fulvidraco]
MQCMETSLGFMSWSFIIGGVLYFLRQVKVNTQYGRYVETIKAPGVMVPSKIAWFIQELPSVLIPVFLLLTTDTLHGLGRDVLLWTFCLHYFHRTFIYSLLNKGRPCPLFIMVWAVVFCSLNGFLQGHYMLHCAHYDDLWHKDVRFIVGLLLFFSGMAINIHSDHILRNLRKPGEITYKIPQGGMFELVSGANFFGEILEWCGYAIATWSLPTFSFAFFTVCSIGPRAYHHHRYYIKKFDNYPKSRKAVIPFLL